MGKKGMRKGECLLEVKPSDFDSGNEELSEEVDEILYNNKFEIERGLVW